MKKYGIVVVLFVSLGIMVAAVSAQGQGGGYGMGPGMMGGYGGGGYYCPNCGAYLGPRGGYGMGPGMMGGWGPGHRWYGQGVQNEACQKFLDETAGLRKDLHNKRFEYYEMVRNPKANPDDITKKEKETRDIQEKIYAKNPQNCWW
ncbi:MAG: hypothetical protein A4E63_02245 [Syntrophorhabdus sp. PtaU1.Bin050]|nr:MAG: hypothetical protein A4E63_02245 [Syntrophorhabdus sp. PtaU1.Bin050]